MLVQKGYGTYSTKVDMFALGLLLAYMLLGKDLLEGKPIHEEQLREYENVLGKPSAELDLKSVIQVGVDLTLANDQARIPATSDSSLSLLVSLLEPSPSLRVSALDLSRTLS
jgi:serine/threonine protein kinase